eukprot:jgi/Tetstr1/464676/TSEL_009428.t2
MASARLLARGSVGPPVPARNVVDSPNNKPVRGAANSSSLRHTAVVVALVLLMAALNLVPHSGLPGARPAGQIPRPRAFGEGRPLSDTGGAAAQRVGDATRRHAQAAVVAKADSPRLLVPKRLDVEGINICKRAAAPVLAKLRQEVAGEVLCPGDPSFSETIAVFNARYQQQPALVILPRSTEGVGAALRFAREHGLRVSVKNGGHNPAGLSVVEGAVLIHMKHFDSVHIDTTQRTVTVGGGVLWEKVYAAFKGTDMAIVGGGCPSVGVVGLALSGGIGWLSRTHGLVADNLLAATVVQPNGSTIQATLQQHPEMLWALRGAGGSNFGVVVSATLAVHPAQPTYFAGSYAVAVQTSQRLLELLRILIDFEGSLTDDRLTADLLVNRMKSGYAAVRPAVVSVVLFFNGPKEEGPIVARPLLQALADWLDPDELCRSGMKKCRSEGDRAELLQAERAALTNGTAFLQPNHNFTTFASSFGSDPKSTYRAEWKSAFVDAFPDDVLGAIARHMVDGTAAAAPGSVIMIQLEGLGGAMRREPPGGAAYPHRDRNWLISFQAMVRTQRGQVTAPQQALSQYTFTRKWAEAGYAIVAGISNGSYAGYADPHLSNWAQRYYSAPVYQQLSRLKRGTDAADVFDTPQRIGWTDDGRAAWAVPLDGPAASGRASAAVSRAAWALQSHPVAGPSGRLRHAAGGASPGALRLWPSAARAACAGGVPSAEAARLFQHPSLECCPGWAIDLGVRARRGAPVMPDDGMPSLRGKRMLVVGATSGIGNAVARMLAMLGASVLMAQRGVGSCAHEAARAAAELRLAEGALQCVRLDLADFSTIPGAAAEIAAGGPLDGVVVSAVTWGAYRQVPAAANASTVLAVSNLGPYVLLRELVQAGSMHSEPKAEGGAAARPAPTRVVVISSWSAAMADENSVLEFLHNRPWTGDNHIQSLSDPPIAAYSAAKAAAVMMVTELAERLQGVLELDSILPAVSVRTNSTATVTEPGGSGFKLENLGTAEENALAVVSLLVRGEHGAKGDFPCATPELQAAGSTGQPDGGSASPGSRLPEFLRPGSLLQCQALELMAARVASADGDRAPLGVPDSQVGSVKDRMLGKLSGRRPECAVALD